MRDCIRQFWKYIRTRDLTFWSLISTFLLVFITLLLALATKQMADVMSKDYMIRTMPIFRITTPKLSTSETDTTIQFSIANVSQGVAKKTIHNVFLETADGRIIRVENIIVGKGKWAKKLYQIPIDYVAGSQEDIKLWWPKKNAPPTELKTIVIAMSFRTLFDDKDNLHIEGYIYEPDHNNFDTMTEDRLSSVLRKIKKDVGINYK